MDFNGAKVALFLGDRLVTIQRDDISGIPYPGLWDLPGGGREGAETPFETVAREVREEIGLILPVSGVLWQARFAAQHIKGAFIEFFVARMPRSTAQDIVFGDEGQGWTLMTLDEFVARKDAVPSYAARLARWQSETGGLPGI
jgi:8-oxo-dGTP diphosphatase